MSSLRYYPMVALGAGAALLGYAVLSRKARSRRSRWSTSAAPS